MKVSREALRTPWLQEMRMQLFITIQICKDHLHLTISSEMCRGASRNPNPCGHPTRQRINKTGSKGLREGWDGRAFRASQVVFGFQAMAALETCHQEAVAVGRWKKSRNQPNIPRLARYTIIPPVHLPDGPKANSQSRPNREELSVKQSRLLF